MFPWIPFKNYVFYSAHLQERTPHPPRWAVLRETAIQMILPTVRPTRGRRGKERGREGEKGRLRRVGGRRRTPVVQKEWCSLW